VVVNIDVSEWVDSNIFWMEVGYAFFRVECLFNGCIVAPVKSLCNKYLYSMSINMRSLSASMGECCHVDV
jgi:hypothetical protein